MKKKNTGKRAGKSSVVKRNLSEYPSINPKVNTRVRQEFLDADYLDKLSDEELKFYNKFCAEYYNANFVRKDGPESEYCDEKNIHQNLKAKEVRKELTDDNNRRNNDMFGSRRAMGQLIYLDSTAMESVIESTQYPEVNYFEDSIADLSEPVKRSRKKKKAI